MTTCINCEQRTAVEGFVYCVECKELISENIKRSIESYQLDIARRMKARREGLLK